MKKNLYKKIFVIGAAVFFIFAPVGIAAAATPTSTTTTVGGSVGQTQAQNVNPLSCAQQPATCAVYVVSLVVNGAMGLLIMGGAFLVKLGLQFNDNIFNAPAVQIGFSVSLAIANLGFVLGIIIIAIATIIRNQTYGIKQLLWKLVMMAILVNFGLVITAPIVGFANSMSTYFINATSPSAATGGYSAYVETMTSAFNPQAIEEAPAANNTASATTISSTTTAMCQHFFISGLATGVGVADMYAMCKIAGKQTSDPATNYWQSIMAMLFDIAFSAIAAFTFICLAILLIIRFLMLGGLLIVLPLAWLTYVFPKFDNSFSKWWNAFVKWTFFPPLALFFIYLAFSTAVIAGTSNSSTKAASYTAAAVGGTGTDTTLVGGMVQATGLSGDIFVQAADEILLVGLMIMGLMFANSLSGKAGKATVGAVSGGSKAFGTWAGKRGRRAGYNAATRVLQPKPKIDPATGAMYTPLTQMNRLRGVASQWTAERAASPDLKTKGLAGTVWGGMKSGSGLFKKKTGAKDWECQNCHSHVERSTKKPTRTCPNCGATAAVANWTEV